jgi:hypothetical protein
MITPSLAVQIKSMVATIQQWNKELHKHAEIHLDRESMYTPDETFLDG